MMHAAIDSRELKQRLAAFPPPSLVDVRTQEAFAADTNALMLAAQAPGLLAVSHGLSRMFADDHAMLKWGCLVYDSLYAWCREQATATAGRTAVSA